MQRDATTHAGFSMASAWLPLADDYVHENAAIWKPMQLRFWICKALIAVRKEFSQLVTGGYEPVAAQGNILVYRRVGAAGAIVIALNLTRNPSRFRRALSAPAAKSCSLRLWIDRGAHRKRAQAGRQRRCDSRNARSWRMTGFPAGIDIYIAAFEQVVEPPTRYQR
jgi:hypothetical protein